MSVVDEENVILRFLNMINFRKGCDGYAAHYRLYTACFSKYYRV